MAEYGTSQSGSSSSVPSSTTSQTAESQAAEPAERRSARDAMEAATDQVSRLFRGFFFAGLESISVTADLAKEFVDKASDRNRNDKKDRDTLTKQLTYLPIDIAEASMDVLDSSIDKTDQIVDKFTDTYKEKKEDDVV